MRARRPVYTSTRKSLADHKLEICQRIICELIATFEVDDDTTDAGSEQVAPSLTRKKRRRPPRARDGWEAITSTHPTPPASQRL
jgi:hypothetical protein